MLRFFIVFTLIFSLTTFSVFGCSEILLNKTGDNIISGRIMDFNFDFKSKFVPIVKGTKVDIVLQNGKKAGTIETLYGFVAIDTVEKPFFSDGMNTEGLSIAALWLDETDYSKAKDYPGKKEIPSVYMIYYMLGLCKNITEVKSVFDKTVFTETIVKEVGGKAPMHIMFHDRDGKSLIVEFVNGKTFFYDHPVFCNSPTMDRHLAKLKEYKQMVKNDAKMEGWVGMSKLIDKNYNDERFLLLNYINDSVGESDTVKASVANCFRVLGRVNIAAHENDNGMTGEGASSNMWDIVRDHKNLQIYYKSYINQTIQMVDINKLLENPDQKIYLTGGDWYGEATR